MTDPEGIHRRWWTNCPECDTAYTIEASRGAPSLTDPMAEENEWLNCPWDGAWLRDWSGDDFRTPPAVPEVSA